MKKLNSRIEVVNEWTNNANLLDIVLIVVTIMGIITLAVCAPSIITWFVSYMTDVINDCVDKVVASWNYICQYIN